MKLRTLTVRGVPDGVLRILHAAAERNRRSLNGELLVIIDRAAAGEASAARPQGGVARESVAAPYPAVQGARAGAIPATKPVAPGIPVDRAALAALCGRRHIRSLAVFGSVLRDDFRPDSDVDLLVEFEPGMTPGFGIITIQDELSELFGGRRVDLVSAKYLNHRLRDRVLASARRLYPDG